MSDACASFFVFVSKPTRQTTDIQTAAEASKDEGAEQRGLISGDGMCRPNGASPLTTIRSARVDRSALLAVLEALLVAHRQRAYISTRLMPASRLSDS